MLAEGDCAPRRTIANKATAAPRHGRMQTSYSKLQAKSKLYDAGGLGPSDASGSDSIHLLIRQVEVGVIGDVKRLPSKLRACPLGDAEAFTERRIECHESGPVQNIST